MLDRLENFDDETYRALVKTREIQKTHGDAMRISTTNFFYHAYSIDVVYYFVMTWRMLILRGSGTRELKKKIGFVSSLSEKNSVVFFAGKLALVLFSGERNVLIDSSKTPSMFVIVMISYYPVNARMFWLLWRKKVESERFCEVINFLFHSSNFGLIVKHWFPKNSA